ncbi:MAG: tetratricopeptide repeat protein [Steroidobacter sp.]
MTNIQDRMGDSSDEGQLRYLHAAELAQQQRYAEAENEFAAALVMNPSLHTARFQLGLLQLTNGNVDAARSTWASLMDTASPAELQCFVRGLDALIQDDFPTAIAHLQKGISLNRTNAPLNKDMAMVIEKINAANTHTSAPRVAATSTAEPESLSTRTDFSLYNQKY